MRRRTGPQPSPVRRLVLLGLAAALSTGALAACGAGAAQDGAGGARGGADYAALVEASRGLLGAKLRPVDLPGELEQRVGTLSIAPEIPEGEVAETLSTAHLDPAGVPTSPAPADAFGDAAAALAGAEVLTRHPLAGADGTRTVPVALAPSGDLLATRSQAAPPGEASAAEPYSMVLVEPGGELTEIAGVADIAQPGMQTVRASASDRYVAWVQAPDTDLYTLTWQLVLADLEAGETRVLADAQELLGIDGALPAFSQWNAPVITKDAVYQATTLPYQDGPWVSDEDGSAWIGGIVGAPLGGGDPEVVAAGTRLTATDGERVVHLVDEPLTAPSGFGQDANGDDGAPYRFVLISQTLGGEGEAWVTGELPADSSITSIALSEQLLVWVVSHFDSETATLLALDRESGTLRAVELGDILAYPSVVGRRVGWGNWSGNNDAGEYLWEIPAPSSARGPTAHRDDDAFGLIRLGENPGGARVRIAGERGQFISVTGTIGVPTTGPNALNAAGGWRGEEPAGVPVGTLVDVVFRLD